MSDWTTSGIVLSMWTTSSPRSTRFAAYTGMVLVSSGSMVLFPLFPALQSELGLPTASVGLVAAAGFAATLVAELFVAPQADRGHVRSMATIGILLMALSLAGSALASEAWHLMAGRAVGGFGMGLFLAAASALLVRSDPRRSGERLGRLGAAELAGISLGPLAAALGLEVFDPAGVFLVSSAIVAAGAVVTFTWMREPSIEQVGIKVSFVAFDLLRSRFVIGAVVLQVAVMVPVGAYDAIWPRFMTDIGASTLLTAASYTLFAIPYVIIAGWAGRLADRLGGAQAYARGILILIATIALYGVLANPWIATGLGFIESSGQALAFIGAAAAMAHIVHPSRAASGQGLARAAGLTAATIASALSGIVYAGAGATWLFFGTAATVAAASTVGLVFLRGARARRTTSEADVETPREMRTSPDRPAVSETQESRTS